MRRIPKEKSSSKSLNINGAGNAGRQGASMQMVLIFQRNCSQSLKELDFSIVPAPCTKLICVKLEDGCMSAEVAAVWGKS